MQGPHCHTNALYFRIYGFTCIFLNDVRMRCHTFLFRMLLFKQLVMYLKKEIMRYCMETKNCLTLFFFTFYIVKSMLMNSITKNKKSDIFHPSISCCSRFHGKQSKQTQRLLRGHRGVPKTAERYNHSSIS